MKAYLEDPRVKDIPKKAKKDSSMFSDLVRAQSTTKDTRNEKPKSKKKKRYTSITEELMGKEEKTSNLNSYRMGT